MDPITHLYIAENIVKNNSNLEKLIDDYNLFLFSNFAPDFDMWYKFLPVLHLLSFHNFKIQHINDATLGTMLHGEKYKVNDINFYGVDFFTHNKNGFVKRNKEKVKEILEYYHVNTLPWSYHAYIEYSVGNKIAQDDKIWNKFLELYDDFDKYLMKYYDLLEEDRSMSKFQKKVKGIIKLFIKHYTDIRDEPYKVIRNIGYLFTAGLKYFDKNYENRIKKAFYEVQDSLNYEKFLDSLLNYYSNLDFNLLEEIKRIKLYDQNNYDKWLNSLNESFSYNLFFETYEDAEKVKLES